MFHNVQGKYRAVIALKWVATESCIQYSVDLVCPEMTKITQVVMPKMSKITYNLSCETY